MYFNKVTLIEVKRRREFYKTMKVRERGTLKLYNKEVLYTRKWIPCHTDAATLIFHYNYISLP